MFYILEMMNASARLANLARAVLHSAVASCRASAVLTPWADDAIDRARLRVADLKQEGSRWEGRPLCVGPS